MLQNYLKIAWRNLLKDRQFTLLNLTGLAVGLSCAFLIYLWVADEIRVDHLDNRDDRRFQVMVNSGSSQGIRTIPETPALLADALTREIPEVEYSAASQISFSGKHTLSAGEKVIKATGLYVTGDYFHVFSWPLLTGDKEKPIPDKSSIVLSKDMASRLFGSPEAAIGKQVALQHARIFRVSAVLNDLPVNSSVQFDCLLPFDIFLDDNPYEREWNNSDPHTYVILKPGANIALVDQKMNAFIRTKGWTAGPSLFLRKYADGYLYGKYENGRQAGGRIEYVKLFSLIAVFILVIACINFMNLATAKAAKRMKEVGIKKCVGASRQALVVQFLGEYLLMAVCSLALALLLVYACIPFFNEITGKQLSLHASPGLFAAFGIITLVTGLLAGSYPAFYLSRFRPVAVLKGKLRNSIGELWIRKGLMVFQFTLSISFIIGAIMVYRQISFIQHSDKGFNKENTISFNAEGATMAGINAFASGLQTFLTKVRTIPGVVNASSMDHNSIIADFGSTSDLSWPGKQPGTSVSFANIGMGYGMIETLGMHIVTGRSFSRDLSSDSSEIIFNETAIRAMGLKDPVGKKIHMWGTDRTIVGIVRDFQYESAHQNIQPYALRLEPRDTYRVMVRMRAGMEQSVIDRLHQLYQEQYPGYVFDYQFLDSDFQALYTAERQVEQLSRWFTGLAVLICCLGLFGLAAFNVERRFKEIGIRKVLGASTSGLVALLSGDFLQLVFISCLIAFPLAWWATDQWLNGFAYRTHINAGIFLAAGASMLLITLLTISLQSIRAALTNPVKSLRTE